MLSEKLIGVLVLLLSLGWIGDFFPHFRDSSGRFRLLCRFIPRFFFLNLYLRLRYLFNFLILPLIHVLLDFSDFFHALGLIVLFKSMFMPLTKSGDSLASISSSAFLIAVCRRCRDIERKVGPRVPARAMIPRLVNACFAGVASEHAVVGLEL